MIQLAAVFGLAPLISGLIKKLKAGFQSRRGPGVLQPYHDLVKRFRKDAVVSEHTSWIFRITPYVVFGATATASLLIPVFSTALPAGFSGDVVAVVALFALARFFTALAGLDAGSAFGGMGSSREMVVAALAEPSMMVAIFSVALRAGSVSLGPAVDRLSRSGGDLLHPAHLLAFGALFLVAIAETGRIPVDNPATHLELTMIHEGMILEYSGRGLALIEWAASAKQLLFFALLANLFLPIGITSEETAGALAVSLALFLAKAALLALLVAVIESSLAKLRFFRVPELLGASFVLSLSALVTFYIVKG